MRVTKTMVYNYILTAIGDGELTWDCFRCFNHFCDDIMAGAILIEVNTPDPNWLSDPSRTAEEKKGIFIGMINRKINEKITSYKIIFSHNLGRISERKQNNIWRKT